MTRILIADDEQFALETLREVLESAGYEVTCVAHGREALKAVEDQSCRLLISDWMMPEMDGLELCQEIRRRDLPGYTYIILLTARDSAQDAVEGLTAGADDLVTKPYHPAELLARVRIGERILSLETRDVAIFALAKLAESRDPETGQHLERIRTYCRILTETLLAMPGFNERVHPEFSRLIYLTSPLHDIGKVGLPDSVLLKPGRLSDAEFEIMKTHTTIGASTLDAALQQYPGAAYLRIAQEIALTHHERFDGRGYPRGLSGKSIPLSGRIVALADVYDALTTKRSYKPAYTHEIARSMILRETGKHFDPDVVSAFMQCESEFLNVLEKQNQSGAERADYLEIRGVNG